MPLSLFSWNTQLMYFLCFLPDLLKLCLLTPLRMCGGLNKNGPQRLADLNAYSPGSHTNRKCGLVGRNVSPRVRFQTLKPVQCLSLPAACRTPGYLSSTMSACMPICSCHEDNGLTAGTVSQSQVNVFLCKSCCGHGFSSQQ